jgi:cell division protein FtsB
MKKALKFITNKYVVSIFAFVVWMCFFDQRDIFNTIDQKKTLNDLLAKKHYYVQEIATAQQELTDLQNNSIALEKFAREKYLMKKDGEDLYIIEDTTQIKK